MSFNFLQNVNNLGLLTVGISVAAIAILGYIAYFSNPKSSTNRSFLFFAIMTIIYGIINYSNYQASNATIALWLLRLTLFSATWHAFALYQLFSVFPEEKFMASKRYKTILVPAVILVSLLTLTPFVFSRIIAAPVVGQVSNPERGAGIALFGLMVVYLVFGGLVKIIRKTRNAKNPLQKEQFELVLTGSVLTFFMIILCNFIFPVFFNILALIPLAPIFFLPFILFTAYAIIRYHLLNIKVVATEVSVFVLVLGTLFEVVNSTSILDATFRFLIFLLILIVGIVLIRSVRREIAQREQLEVLDKQLETANDQLKVLDQARSEFITIASHQLRTPPATMKWYLASILGGDFGKLPKSVSEQLSKVQWTNDSLISLIEDLLNVSRIERGKLEFVFEPTDILAITQMTVDQLRPQAENKKLKLLFTKPKISIPFITADKEKLRQVINNFIDNAIKYSKEGTIQVELSKTATDVVVKVKDSGKGVTPEQRDSIFKKFDRGKEAAKNSTGLGLGLYVAKVIIEQHQGKIWVESPGLGKGATFIFSIPIKSDLKASTYDLTKNQNN